MVYEMRQHVGWFPWVLNYTLAALKFSSKKKSKKICGNLLLREFRNSLKYFWVKSSYNTLGLLIISLFDCIDVVPVLAVLKCVLKLPDSPLLLLLVSLEQFCLNSSGSSMSVLSTIWTPLLSSIDWSPTNIHLYMLFSSLFSLPYLSCCSSN